jgi:HEAT repeat protein
MKLKLQRFGWCVVFTALTAVALAATDSTASSAEKARKAVSILQSGAPGAEKAIACKELAVYGTVDAVPALAKLLTDQELASWARIALEAIPGSAADKALRDALPKLQGQLLVGVINSIGVRRDPKAVSALVGKLKAKDAEVAAAAAVALGHIGGDKAAKALTKALTSTPVGTRSAVAQGCILSAERFLAEGDQAKATKLYDTVRKADVPQQRILEATRGAILARQADGIPLLLETLHSRDKAVLSIGLRTARELPGNAVTEALAVELGSAPPDRAGPLFLALADRKDTAVLPVVLRTGRSGAKPLRLLAIEVMIRSGDPACVPVLLDTLGESDADLAKAAKGALAGWWGREVDVQLTSRLPQATGNTRRLQVELAGQRHVAAAIPELVKAASDSDPAIRAAGIKALGETVDTANLGALTELLTKATSADDVTAVQAALENACTRIPDKAGCADKLLPCLAASPVPARCALLHVLGVVSTPTALAAVQAELASAEPTVRDTAVRVLADWSDASALPAVMEVFRTTQDESHRFLALRGCVRQLELSSQPVPEKVKAFSELLARTERSDDRKAILSGLANVADPAALKLVEPFLADAQVQAEAELAALNIATGIVSSAPAEAKAIATRIQAESKNQATRDRAAKVLAKLEKGR